jgi:predicted site-specific integrase-resolvase
MKLSAYAKKLGVCYRTAWNMFQAGQIPGAYKLPSSTIIVPDSALQIQQSETIKKDIQVCIYARVSSSQNKNNLDSQAQRLENFCIAKGWRIKRIIKEIGSGINDKRTQLESLIRSITDYDYVVVEHKDRLTRFGFNYFNSFCPEKFYVVNQTEDKTEDLINDLVSIITSFCSRLYGKRRGKRKTEKLIKELQDD